MAERDPVLFPRTAFRQGTVQRGDEVLYLDKFLDFIERANITTSNILELILSKDKKGRSIIPSPLSEQ
jgi:hypothetical protein